MDRGVIFSAPELYIHTMKQNSGTNNMKDKRARLSAGPRGIHDLVLFDEPDFRIYGLLGLFLSLIEGYLILLKEVSAFGVDRNDKGTELLYL